MPPKRKSTSAASASAAPAMTQAAIRKLVTDSVVATLEAQAANMANANNTNRNPEPKEVHVARKLFSRSNCTEDYKVKFATGTLIEEALSWWNSFAQPIGIEKAYKITCVEFKKLSIKKYCPRTEIQKMEDEFYHLIVKGNNLKTYRERTLCKSVPKDHYQQCQGRAYMLRNRNAHQDPNIVTGIYLEMSSFCSPSDGEEVRREKTRRYPNSQRTPKSFLENLPGLLLIRQVEFQIDLTPGVEPVARAPYRLAPSEMQELSNQLQELTD
uniref:Reverse transcriptase domain-containing protein n=1 Tax=Tanacetum cinerariifolium TaxID=118510 RepID=A0A699GPS4_TANCI|nr:reverse transcriptase domain-containing protein [Tanacetum cinerariifolium]